MRIRLYRGRRAAAVNRGKIAIGKLIAAATLAGALAVAAPAAAPLHLDALRWTAPGAEVAALTTQPAACLTLPAGDTAPVLAGHALFNSPTLLGGQAAKAGLSCASCHVNGRGNTHFLLAGVSDAPGTADVTTSFFGTARSNGRFDPVPIPDLALPGKVARGPDARTLEIFIRTLIVDEFSGQEPSPAMLIALATYVRAVGVCPGDTGEPVPRGVGDALLIVDAAIAGAADMAGRGESQAARSLIAAARHQLGLMSERFAGPRLARERAALLDASRALQRLGDGPLVPAPWNATLRRWHADFTGGLAKRLRDRELDSLYYPANLGFVAPQRDNR